MGRSALHAVLAASVCAAGLLDVVSVDAAEIEVPGLKLDGISADMFNCSKPATTSSVNVDVPQVGVKAQGTVSRTGCHLAQVSLRVVASASAPVSAWGAELSSLHVELQNTFGSNGDEVWSGLLSGSASFEGQAGTARIEIGAGGVTSFKVSAPFQSGPVASNGNIDFAFTKSGAAVLGSGAVRVTAGSVAAEGSGQLQYTRGTASRAALWAVDVQSSAGVGVFGLTLSAVRVAVQRSGNVSSSGVWSGKLAGTFATQDFSASVKTVLVSSSPAVFGPLEGAVSVSQSGVAFEGQLSVSPNQQAAGSCAKLSVSGTGTLAGGQIAEFDAALAYDQCGKERFQLTGSLPQAVAGGVQITDVAVNVAGVAGSGGALAWSGAVRGSVSFLEGAAAGTAEIAFANTKLQQATMSVALASGPASGQMDLAVANGGVWSGSMVLQVATDNVQVSGMAGTVQYNSADGGAFAVQAGVSELTVFGVALRDVQVDLQRLRDNTTVAAAWSGSIGGTAQFGDAVTAQVTAVLAGNAFQSLEGQLDVAEAGVAFSGTVEVDAGKQCSGVAAQGTLAVDSVAGLTAGLTIDMCAPAGKPKYTLTAATTGGVSLGGLSLSSAQVVLRKPAGGAFSGTFAANAPLFGGNTRATVAFAAGKLQSVQLSTTVTVVGVMTGAFKFEYKPGCSSALTGEAAMAVTVPGADAADFTGTVVLTPTQVGAKCVWDLAVTAGMTGAVWEGPGSTTLSGVTLSVATQHDSGAVAGAKLRQRVWVGRVEGTVASSGLSGYVALDSRNSTVEAGLEFEDNNVALAVSYSSNCVGRGTVVVKNLGHGIQGGEVSVVFQKACGTSSKAWTATGTLSGFQVPLAGGKRMLEIPDAVVTVTQNAAGTLKTVQIGGTFLDIFTLGLEFTLPYDAARLKLVGTAKAAQPVSPSELLSRWGGGGLDTSLRAFASPVYDALNEIKLSTVVLEVSLLKKSVELSGTGTAFGVGFQVAVGIADSPRAGWGFGVGMQFTNKAGAGTPSLPGLVGKVVQYLPAETLSFTLSKGALSFGPFKTRRSGLAVGSLVSMGSGLLGDLVSKTSGTPVGGLLSGGAQAARLQLEGVFSSITDLDVSVSLPGRVDMIKDHFSIEKLSALFRFSATGMPEIGFLVSLRIAFGSPQRIIMPAGALLVKPSGFGLEASLDVKPDWKDPFGLKGVTVLFPWAIGSMVSATTLMLPNKLAFIGGAEVAGVSGRLAFTADVDNLANTAFQADLRGLDLGRVVSEIAHCSACQSGVAGMLLKVQVGRLFANYNPSPSPVELTIADASATIQPGIVANISEFNLWQVIRGSGFLSVSEKDVKGLLEVAPVVWGPLRLTRSLSDTTQGPYFAVELSKEKRLLEVRGAASLLSQHIEVQMILNDATVRAQLNMAFGALRAEVELLTDVKSGVDFDVLVRGRVTNSLADIAAFLAAPLKRLGELAASGLAEAQAGLAKARADLEAAKRALNSARVEGRVDFDAAQRILGDANAKFRECKRREEDCSDAPWYKKYMCARVVGCWIEYGGRAVAQAAVRAAQSIVNNALKAWNAAVGAASAVVSAVSDSLMLAESAMSYASEVVQNMDRLTSVLGVLGNVIEVNAVTFETAASPSDVDVKFALDVTLMKQRKVLAMTAALDYDMIVRFLQGAVQDAVGGFFGDDNPVRASIVPQYGTVGCQRGAGGKSGALVGQKVACPRAIAGFQMNTVGCVTQGGGVQVAMSCKFGGVFSTQVPKVCETRHTGCVALSGVPVANMFAGVGGGLACGDGEAMASWELDDNSGGACPAGKHRFSYKCCSGLDQMAHAVVNTEHSACFDGSGGVEHMPPVRCDREGVLKAWRVTQGGWGGCTRVEYDCLGKWSASRTDCFDAKYNLFERVIACKSSGRHLAMNGFDIAQHGCPQADQARVQTLCQSTESFPIETCHQQESACYDIGRDLSQFWKRDEITGVSIDGKQLWVGCPAGDVMESLRLEETGQANCHRFKFNCCPPKMATVSVRRTTEGGPDISSIGGGRSGVDESKHFYGHQVHCDYGMALNSLTFHRTYVEYICVGPSASAVPTPAPSVTPAPTGAPAPISPDVDYTVSAQACADLGSSPMEALTKGWWWGCGEKAMNGFSVRVAPCTEARAVQQEVRCLSSDTLPTSSCRTYLSGCAEVSSTSSLMSPQQTWVGCPAGQAMASFTFGRQGSCERFSVQCCEVGVPSGYRIRTETRRTVGTGKLESSGDMGNFDGHKPYCGGRGALNRWSMEGEDSVARRFVYECLVVEAVPPAPAPAPAPSSSCVQVGSTKDALLGAFSCSATTAMRGFGVAVPTACAQQGQGYVQRQAACQAASVVAVNSATCTVHRSDTCVSEYSDLRDMAPQNGNALRWVACPLGQVMTEFAIEATNPSKCRYYRMRCCNVHIGDTSTHRLREAELTTAAHRGGVLLPNYLDNMEAFAKHVPDCGPRGVLNGWSVMKYRQGFVYKCISVELKAEAPTPAPTPVPTPSPGPCPGGREVCVFGHCVCVPF